MKRFISLFLVFIIQGITVPCFSKSQPDLNIKVRRINPRIIVLSLDGPMDNNVIALQSEKGIVVVDSHISPSISLPIREKIEDVFARKDFCYLIFTHSHGDHTWGSQVFPEATVIAQENCLDEMAGIEEEVSGDIQRTQSYIDHLEEQSKSMDNTSQDYEEIENTTTFYKTILEGWIKNFSPILPNLAFAEKLQIDLGDVRLFLYHFPSAHSESDIIIHCPEEDLLMTGDLFVPGMNPSFVKTDTVPIIPVWISVLESVLSENELPSFVIPGHGDFLEPNSLKTVNEYFKNQLSAMKGKKNAFPIFEKALDEIGIKAGLEKLRVLSLSDEYFLLENDLSSQGYFWLYREKKTREAIAVFKIMTEIFPESWNAWDCLGEGYMTDDDVKQAILCYQKSLELNPDNANGQAMLKRLQEKK